MPRAGAGGGGAARDSGEGGGGEGVGVSQRVQDRRQNAFRIRENVIVPKADDTPAAAFKPCRALRISGALIVLAAIRLDHEVMLRAGEVDDKPADRMLAAEFIVLQAPV